jgi:hypothetical protein
VLAHVVAFVYDPFDLGQPSHNFLRCFSPLLNLCVGQCYSKYKSSLGDWAKYRASSGALVAFTTVLAIAGPYRFVFHPVQLD